MNNWKKDGPYAPVHNTNPGGNSFVIAPGRGRADEDAADRAAAA